MKKIINIVILLLILSFGFWGCNRIEKDETTTATQHKENLTEIVQSTVNQPKAKDLSETEFLDIGGGILTVQKYRSCYYSIPAPFVELVGRNVYYEWMHTVDYTETAEKMVMLQFVQHFGITREQFDKANLKIARIIRDDLDGRPCLNPKDYANQISDEIYNADIIFTFNDEIINEYYLSPEYPYLYASEYDEAVANGTYQTQTTDWIDVEQMEAEIIAKYGEAEHVSEISKETTASTPENDVAEEQPQVTTNEQTP